MEETSDENSSVADNETVEDEHSQEEIIEVAEEKTVRQESRVTRAYESSNIIWRYYKRLLPSSEKMAKCKLCREIKSFRTTVTNLKMHIWLKHPEIERQEPALARRKKRRVKQKSQSEDDDTEDDVDNESSKAAEKDERDYKPEQNDTRLKSITFKRQRASTCYVWKYFRPMEPVKDKMARCNFCRKMFSYKTTVTNLKTHLGIKHADLVKDDVHFRSEKKLKCGRDQSEKGIWEYLEIDTDDNDDDGAQQNDATDNTVKFTSEIWKQFNHDDDEPTCNLCRDMVPNSIEEMKNHLEERHSILLDQIMQKVLDAASGDETDVEEDNTFTEIVYLEDEQTRVPNKPSPKIKRTIREDIRPLPKVTLEKNVSESSEEAVPIRKSTPTPPPPDDLDVYLKYVKVLLQKVPQESTQKLHLDIINLIMNATRQSHKNIIIETMNLNTAPNTSNLTTVLNTGTNVLLNQNRNVIDNTRRYISVPVQKLVTENDPKNIPVPQLVMISANNNVSRSIYNNPSAHIQ